MPFLLSALALVTAVPAAWASNATTTSLFVTPDSPSSGAVMTMTAQVSSVEVAVVGGTVTFVDTYNGVSETLGTVQVQSNNGSPGLAIFETEVGGVGTHQFVATYNGTSTLATSASSPQAVNFVAPYLSATALTDTGSAPNYTFTATVSAFGPLAPTGNVTFTDTTSSVTLGTAALNSSTLLTGFAPYQSYPIANMDNGQTGSTNGPAVGDFNGDGRPDYAVPTNGGPIVILLGKGNGTFTTGTPINTTGFTPTSVVVDDFNGDGKQDLAVLGAAGTGSVNIYLGNGDGTFATAKNYPVATSTSASRLLAEGDFNRDGIPDLVASNSGLNQVTILLGNGDGSFQAPVPYAVGPAPWNVAVGDINQDGFLDLAVSSDGGNNITLLLGNGDGTFQTATSVSTPGAQVGSVAIGDFNGDGYPDLATTSAPNNSIYVLINNGTSTPSFQAPVTYNMPNTGPYYLTIGDFNRDGKLDIISANNGNDTVGVLLGTGTSAGTFGTPAYYQVGGGAIFASAGDINGDDQVDLTTVTGTGLSVLLSGESEMASISNIAINGCSTQTVTATYAGDGNYGSSTSAPVSLAASTQTTALTLAANPAAINQGQQTTLTATLSPYNYGSTSSNGDTVTFLNNGLSIGTAKLANGVAVLVWTPAATGPYSIQATYPGDCAFAPSNSNKITGSILLSPGLHWATPAAINYGTPLSATQLDATAITAGTFVYSPPATTVLPAGTSTLNVTFTPTSSSYGTETASVQIVVNQDPTVITWPIPTPITYGTPLSGFQLDATASGGVVSVPLSTFFNVYGIYTPGSHYAQANSFDNDGYSYSTGTLGSTINWNGMTFNLGPANAKDAVANTTITLPTGNYTNLFMLGAMVNDIKPSGVYYTEPFTVTYTDGSTTVLNQTLSDWVYAAGWPGESVISCAEDRNFDNGTTQADSICVYGYQIVLDPTKTVKTLQLPATRNIVMLAFDLTTPNIPGTFVYTPPSGTVEPVGTDTLSTVFTPNDTTDYKPSSATVKLVVTNAPTPIVTPTISWPTPANITYGTALGPVQLDAVAMGAARPTPATPTSQLSVLSTSNDGTGFVLSGFDGANGAYSYSQLNNGSVNYAGTTFTLGQPGVPNAITNGAVYTLPASGNYSSVYLIGAATTTNQTNEPFILTYSDGTTSTQTLAGMSSWASSAGYAGESIVATTKYKNTSSGGKVAGTYDLYGYQLTANPAKALVSVTLPNTRNVVIMALGFGTNTQVVVPGTYVYSYTIPPNPPVTPASGAVLPVGTWALSVVFTPTDTAAYNGATGSTTITVTQATPVITWPTPAAITVGTPLSATQLDATASSPEGVSLPGTFKYTPPSGTVLAAGAHTLTVLFTPTDTTDYTTATATVQIVVGNAGASGVSGSPAYPSGDCCFFSQPTPYAITVKGSGATPAPTGSVNVVFNGQTIGTGTLTVGTGESSSVTLLLTSSYFVPGNNTVTINYLGDDNYVPNKNTAVIPLRNPAIDAEPTTAKVSTSTIAVPYTYVVAGSMTFNFNPSGQTNPSDFSNETGSGGTTCSSGTQEPAGFVCTFEVSFAPQLPGVRKGVVEVDFTSSTNQAEPKLYLFLNGLGSAAQIVLSNATQATLNSTLNQPESLTFNPTDINNATLYVANSGAPQLDSLASSGGSLTQWNAGNTTNLSYPSDLSFDAFGNLVVSDANAAKVFSFNPALAETTVNTGTYTLGEPTAARFDFGGNLYIADAGTPRIIEIPGETYASYIPSLLSLGSQSLSFPQALAVDNAGANLYVGDGNTNEVLEVALNGSGATVLSLSPCDMTTVATCALNGPAGFAFDPNGDIFITDGSARVLMVPSNHSSGGLTEQLPLTGLVNPSGVTLDGSGDVYVSDLNGMVVKLLVNSGSLPKFTTIGQTQITTLTNTGNLPLKVTGITFASTSFTETDTCVNKSIAGGGTCTITVKYANSSGASSDTLTINSNAFSAGAVTIALSH